MEPPEEMGEGDSTASQQDQVALLNRALEEERERSLRLLADFENFRRRIARERQTAGHEGRREVVLSLLPALDTLEQALAAGSIDSAFYEGVAATYRLLISALREAGAVPIESIGQPFDPNLHEAVGTTPAEGIEPGTVAREVRRGWHLGDDMLRPAQVVVATSAEAAGSWR